MTDWCPFAIKRPIISDNFSQGRAGQQVRAVVLHIAAGPLSGVFPTFNSTARKVSAHFCIGKDGTIEQYVSVNDTAYGNGLAWKDGQWYKTRDDGTQIIIKPTWQDIIPRVNPNAYTVSVEHEGQSADNWTEAMYDANNRLLLWLAEQFDLTYTPHRTLIGHCEIDPVDKAACPGPNVEYARIAADLAALIVARQLTWMPINDQAALYQFAQDNDLGYPQTDEFALTFQNEAYVVQVFNLGIVYVKKGDWGNVKWVKKQ